MNKFTNRKNIMKQNTIKELRNILEIICLRYGERLTGSESNKKLVEYTKRLFRENGYNVEDQVFSCIDWKESGAHLFLNGKELPVKPSYYTTGCQVEAEYMKLSSIEELEKSNLADKIALLYGELTKEQLMPKSFTFYNPKSHKKIINLLEKKKPIAIVTIVDNDTSIFEDGDFDIPSAYISKESGNILLNVEGKINLSIKTERTISSGSNVIARINENKDKKIVITAHLDTKYGTPGALDNGSGIAIILLLSKLIKPEMIDYCLELLLLNGEDYYSTPGQVEYMNKYLKEENNIILSINCDGIGLINSKTAIALMDLADGKELLINNLIAGKDNFEFIEPWVEGDHMLFLMNEIPSIALTSKNIFEIIDSVIHTERDTLNLLDYTKVIETIYFLKDLIIKY